MAVLEQKSDIIFKLNNDLNNFVKTDNKANKLYQKYRKEAAFQGNFYEFLFDKTFNDNKNIIDLYLEKNPKLSNVEQTALLGMKNTLNSVFEVQSIEKDGFELYNLVNEKSYRVKVLIKMANYKNLFKGTFLSSRLIPFDGEFFLFTVDKIMKSSQNIEAYKLAVQMQMDNPCAIYRDNEEKLDKLSKNVAFLGKKFKSFFKGDEVITTNTKVNDLLDVFNDYVEEDLKEDTEEFIETPEKLAYFDISKKKNASKTYDVGLLFDPETGLQTVPFLATFCRIFEVNDYKGVEGYQDCVKEFFNNDKISSNTLKSVYERFGDVFVQRAKQILKLRKEIDFEGLLHKYKGHLLDEKLFSTPTILYSSDAFGSLMELSSKNEGKTRYTTKKVGRNSPCPCGSGKKYKKCCL